MIARIAAFTLFITVAAPLATLAVPALAQAPADTVATLEANGDGQVMVVPDIAIVTIGVVSRAPAASDALAANSTDLQKVVDTVKAAGIAEKDMGTTGFSVTPIYQPVTRTTPPDSGPAPIIGYTVENDLRVTIRNIATSGAVLDAVVKAGANRVSSIAFDISDSKTAEDNATKAAIAEALHRGQLMADASGVTLGRVLSVTTSTGNTGPLPQFARADLAAAPATPVLAGQRSITANASITWAIGAK
jgi:uncharacterized protein YggE